MKLVIDTNILISALIKDSATRKIIFYSQIELYYPEISLKEIEENKNTILEKTGLNEKDYTALLNEILNFVVLMPYVNIEDKIKDAEAIFGKIDVDDIIFVALALSIPNDGIWSDDADFQRQDKIKIWKTKDILGLVNNTEDNASDSFN